MVAGRMDEGDGVAWVVAHGECRANVRCQEQGGERKGGGGRGGGRREGGRCSGPTSSCLSLQSLLFFILTNPSSVCVLGLLHLSLPRTLYTSLGLVGVPSHFTRVASGRFSDRRSGSAERYAVVLDLNAPSFEPGRKGFERTKEALIRLDELHALPWQAVANWEGEACEFFFARGKRAAELGRGGGGEREARQDCFE
jgi:hypothetical protein